MKVRKIKRKLLFNQSESCIQALRLIFLTSARTQVLYNGASISLTCLPFIGMRRICAHRVDLLLKDKLPSVPGPLTILTSRSLMKAY